MERAIGISSVVVTMCIKTNAVIFHVIVDLISRLLPHILLNTVIHNNLQDASIHRLYTRLG